VPSRSSWRGIIVLASEHLELFAQVRQALAIRREGSVAVQPFRLWATMVAREASRPRRRTGIETFSDKFPWLGPTIWVSSVLYFIVQIVVASVWLPSYSWFSNTISDLGNTSCGPKLCSPRHAWMNGEFFVLGAVMAAGALLIYQEFTERDPDE